MMTCVALFRGGLRSHSGTWRQHKKEPDSRAAPASVPPPAAAGSSESRDEPLRGRNPQNSESRDSSSQRRESLTAGNGSSRRGSRAGSRESSSGRRESERRAVASDEGPTVGSRPVGSSSPGKSQDMAERSSKTSMRRERSSSSLRRGSPREDPLRRGSPREESLRRGSPREEPLPPVPSSGRVSRSIENVLSR